MSGYYGLTCLIFILAFIYGKSSVTIHLNLFGEASMELILTLLSIPCVIYVLKDFVDNKKKRRQKEEAE